MPVSAFVDGPEALVLTYGWVITDGALRGWLTVLTEPFEMSVLAR